MANFYWPSTSAGSPRWKPNFHWLMAQAGSRGQPRGMLKFHWPRRPTASLYSDEVASVLEACASCPRAAYFPNMQERSGQQGGELEKAWGQQPS